MIDGDELKYNHIIEGIFLERPNRFIAYCMVDGNQVKVHVKNTGKCKELLVVGCKVYLEYHDNPNRKTNYSLICVLKGTRLINMDSQVPNKVFYESIELGKILLPGLTGSIITLKPEKTYRQSRFDAYIETTREKAFVEVKGVTLEEDGVVLFPDAKTERGVKHVYELINAVKEGYKAYLVFIIQMKEVQHFEPNSKMHKEFAEALLEAANEGVCILAYDTYITPDSIQIGDQVEVKL